MDTPKSPRQPVVAVPYKVPASREEYHPHRFLNGIMFTWVVATLLMVGIGLYCANTLKEAYSTLWSEIYMSVQSKDQHLYTNMHTQRSIVGTNLLRNRPSESNLHYESVRNTIEYDVIAPLAKHYRAVDSSDFGQCHESIKPGSPAENVVTYCYQQNAEFPFQVRIPRHALPKEARLAITLGYIGLREIKTPCLVEMDNHPSEQLCEIIASDGATHVKFKLVWATKSDHYTLQFQSSMTEYFPELVNFRVDVQQAQYPHSNLYAFFHTTNQWIVDTARKRLLETITKTQQAQDAVLHRYHIRERSAPNAAPEASSIIDNTVVTNMLRSLGKHFPHALYMQSFDNQYHLIHSKLSNVGRYRTVNTPAPYTLGTAPELRVKVFTPVFMYGYFAISAVILFTVAWGYQHRKRYLATLTALEHANTTITALKSTLRDQPERYTNLLTSNTEGLHIIRHEISKMLRRKNLKRKSWDLVLDYYRCISTVSLCLNPQQQIFREMRMHVNGADVRQTLQYSLPVLRVQTAVIGNDTGCSYTDYPQLESQTQRDILLVKQVDPTSGDIPFPETLVPFLEIQYELEDIQVNIPSGYLMMILFNLVKNCVDHNQTLSSRQPQPSVLTVSLNPATESDKDLWVKLTLKTPIPVDLALDETKIFTKGFSSKPQEKRSKKKSNTRGIGLFIVKAIAEGYRGMAFAERPQLDQLKIIILLPATANQSVMAKRRSECLELAPS